MTCVLEHGGDFINFISMRSSTWDVGSRDVELYQVFILRTVGTDMIDTLYMDPALGIVHGRIYYGIGGTSHVDKAFGRGNDEFKAISWVLTEASSNGVKNLVVRNLPRE
jgi:hypothetical protein